MAVTNSLFMLACPPLYPLLERSRRAVPTTKEVGATHFVARVRRQLRPAVPRQVYHSRRGCFILPEGAPATCRGCESDRPAASRRRLRERLFQLLLCRHTG